MKRVTWPLSRSTRRRKGSTSCSDCRPLTPWKGFKPTTKGRSHALSGSAELRRLLYTGSDRGADPLEWREEVS